MLRYFAKINFLAKYNIQLPTGSVKVHIFMKILAMSLTGQLNCFHFPIPQCLPNLPLGGIVGSDIRRKRLRELGLIFWSSFSIFFQPVNNYVPLKATLFTILFLYFTT